MSGFSDEHLLLSESDRLEGIASRRRRTFWLIAAFGILSATSGVALSQVDFFQFEHVDPQKLKELTLPVLAVSTILFTAAGFYNHYRYKPAARAAEEAYIEYQREQWSNLNSPPRR